MTMLWSSVASLLLIAALFVAWPYWRYRRDAAALVPKDVDERLEENIALFRDHLAELEHQLRDGRIGQVQFEQLKVEQERALLADEASLRRSASVKTFKNGWVMAALLIMLTAIALTLYAKFGSSEDVAIQQLRQEKAQAEYAAMLANRTADPVRAEALAKKIEERLTAEPENVQYWFILARTYMELNRFADASRAYEEVVKRDRQSGMVLAEAAQAMFLRDGNKVSPPVADLTRSALTREPDNTMALGLMGIVEFNEKHYVEAVRHWRRAIAVLGADSAESMSLNAGIERAKVLYREAGGTDTELEKLLAGKQIQLTVTVSDTVRADPSLWVYVYARAWKGAKMPLAITRVRLSELPRVITLTEAMAMSPAVSLATAQEVELVARVSQDGTATAKPGDWQGSLGPVELDALPDDLRISIDRQIE